MKPEKNGSSFQVIKMVRVNLMRLNALTALVITKPSACSLVVATASWLTTAIITSGPVWSQFSWLQGAAENLKGVLQGISPLLASHCRADVIAGRAIASLASFCFGAVLIFATSIGCITALLKSAEAISFKIGYSSFLKYFLLPILSIVAVRHYWTGAEGGIQSAYINCDTLHSKFYLISYICGVAFLTLIPLLWLVRVGYAFLFTVALIIRAAR